MLTEGNLLMMRTHLPLIHITQARLSELSAFNSRTPGLGAGILSPPAELQFSLTIGF